MHCSIRFLVVTPHKNSLSQLESKTKSLTKSKVSHRKNNIDEKQQRDDIFFQFQKNQRELDCQHEICMIQLTSFTNIAST